MFLAKVPWEEKGWTILGRARAHKLELKMIVVTKSGFEYKDSF